MTRDQAIWDCVIQATACWNHYHSRCLSRQKQKDLFWALDRALPSRFEPKDCFVDCHPRGEVATVFQAVLEERRERDGKQD